MGIKAFQGTSLINYPGKIACAVFYGSCNLRCSFCHNPDLVNDTLTDLAIEDVLSEIAGRKDFIDGVVVTGGEPTLDKDLPDVLAEIKALGLAVKLDTNGLRPDRLKDLCERGLVDTVAVDLKTSPERYTELVQGPIAPGRLKMSVEVLKKHRVPTEFRTTCVPKLVGPEEILALGALIEGADLWVMQQYRPETVLTPDKAPEKAYDLFEITALADIARQFVTTVQMRGI